MHYQLTCLKGTFHWCMTGLGTKITSDPIICGKNQSLIKLHFFTRMPILKQTIFFLSIVLWRQSKIQMTINQNGSVSVNADALKGRTTLNPKFYTRTHWSISWTHLSWMEPIFMAVNVSKSTL